MKIIVSIGIACVDMVFAVDELPTSFEKYRASSFKMVGGGLAGNCAVACARLGASASLITRLGDDAMAQLTLQQLAEYGVDCWHTRLFKGHSSPVSSIFVDNRGERMIMSYSDFTLPDDASWLPPLNADAVTGDTRWETGALHLFKQARANGIPCVLDADRGVQTAELIAVTSHIGFSAKGLREYTGVEDLMVGMKIAISRTSNFVAVTDGAKGVYYSQEGKVEHLAAFPVKAVDTLGAGDTWHGALAVALSEGKPILKALTFANAASALKCTKFGGRAGIPTRVEVDIFLKGT